MGWWSRSSGISRATFLNPYSLSAAFLRESPPERRRMPSERYQGRQRGSRTRTERATAVLIRSRRLVSTDRRRESMGAIDSKHSLDDSRRDATLDRWRTPRTAPSAKFKCSCLSGETRTAIWRAFTSSRSNLRSLATAGRHRQRQSAIMECTPEEPPKIPR